MDWTVRKRAPASQPEVLVVGGGPAGLSLAAEFALLGRSTSLIDVNLGKPWERSYGSFFADLRGAGVEAAIVRLFEEPQVWVDEGSPLLVGESYARLDTSRLQSLLLERAERAGVTLISGSVRNVRLDPITGVGQCEMAEAGPGENTHEPTACEVSAQIVVDAG